MAIMLGIHGAGGIVALLIGFSALVARTGSPLHGQADSLPAPLRIQPVLTALAFLPLLLLFSYLWRYRDRRRSVVAAPAAGIRRPDRVPSAPHARAVLTTKGIP